MSFNTLMHPRNLYKTKLPDFKQLAAKYAEFRLHCAVKPSGKIAFDFKNPDAVRALTLVLLQNDFGYRIELPADCLVPRIPLRLNYILWLQDLLGGNEAFGIDIGTGASCVYPLLGVHQSAKRWKFLATERDSDAAEWARQNVARNNLQDLISVVVVEEGEALCPLLESVPYKEQLFDFCMCNPPFYDHSEAEPAVSEASRASGRCRPRHEPHSATVARRSEVAAEGGEVGFVSRIIDDSARLRSRVRVYTSMLGKKASLAPLKARLSQLEGVCEVCESTFSQGKTQRWALAWTFLGQLALREKSAGSGRLAAIGRKARAPLQMQFAMQSRCGGAGGCSACFGSAVSAVLDIASQLQMETEETNAAGCSKAFQISAYSNTWSNQRRRRRQTLLAEQGGKMLDDEQFEPALKQPRTEQLGSQDHRAQQQKGAAQSAPSQSECSKKGIILKFILQISPLSHSETDCQFTAEFEIVEAENNDLLHQVAQFFKNNLAKQKSTHSQRV